MADAAAGNLGTLIGQKIDLILSKYSYFALAGFIFVFLGVVLIPIPGALLSIFITINLFIGVVILMTSISLKSAAGLAAFPSILLFTTLYRVGLNVSTTRLVLTKGEGGEVVEAFGNFVAGGQMVVGFILFIIFTVFQFIVITKGAERVAEVSARFTLDSMHNKSMAIEADIRSGALTQEDGRKRRQALERENQLMGAMDGAMKFVKGDAVFGIIITLVNFVGGLAIGVAMKHMEVGKAATRYSQLTIGDGLVSQLPALLISIAAGVVVTRVSSDDPDTSLGRDIGSQILAHPRAVASGAVVFLLLGLVPGLPKLPFFAIAAIAGAVAWGLFENERRKNQATTEAEAVQQEAEQRETGYSLAVPIMIEVAEGLTKAIDRDGDGGQKLQKLIPELRDSIYYELGVLVPSLKIRGSIPGDDTFTILLRETPVYPGKIPSGKVLVNQSADDLALFQIQAEPTVNPATGQPAAYISEDSKALLQKAGVQIYEVHEALVLHIAGFLKRYAHEFVGLQEVQAMIEHVQQTHPKLVEEVVPKVVSLHSLTDVLQRLVREGISIRDMKGILEALSEWGRVESDTLQLTELVRSSLSRQICFKYARGDGRLIVYQVDPEIQQTLAESIRHTTTGKYISLAPDIQQEILYAIRRQLGDRPATAQRAVVLTEPEVRPYMRRLVELEFPEAAVISIRELASEVMPQPIGIIAIGR